MADILATTIKITPSQIKLGVGDTRTLTARLTPVDSDSDITWQSSDSAKVSVENGIITGLSVTTNPVIITATANEKSATCAITVVQNFEIVTLDEAKIRLSIDFDDRNSEIQSRIASIQSYIKYGTGINPEEYGSLDDTKQKLIKEYILSTLYYDYYDAHTELNDKRLTAMMKQLQVI